MGLNISTIIYLVENSQFILITRLVQLTTKPLCEASPRLQQLLLKVTQYNFNTMYVKYDGVPVAEIDPDLHTFWI